MVAELLIRRALVGGRLGDLRAEQGRVVDFAPSLARRRGVEEIDAAGGEVIPGLVDHHIHLRALAAAGTSVMAGPPAVTDPPGLAVALATASARLPPGEWIRAVGYHESVAGVLDAAALDRFVGERPLRVQHRGGSLWMCNTAAVAALNLRACAEAGVERDEQGRPTGRLWRMDRWLGQRVARRPGDLGAISRSSAAAGVTGFTDATPDRDQSETDELVAACDEGLIVQRLCLMSPIGTVLPRRAVTATGFGPAGGPRVELGPLKILLDDVDLPTLDTLVDQVLRARTEGRGVAVHCVTRVQLVLTLAALHAAGGSGGHRIEHGALISEEQFPSLRSLQAVVVTQPGLLATRGDQYLQDLDEEDLGDLWRVGSLRRAGVGVALGTDAPYGPADPWATVRAARERTTSAGAVINPSECIGRTEALRLMAGPLGAPGRGGLLAVGQPADLCVLLDGAVTYTVVAGSVVFRTAHSN